jgi:hypothetical protein
MRRADQCGRIDWRGEEQGIENREGVSVAGLN